MKRDLQMNHLDKLCSMEDLTEIFYKIEEIYQYHKQFVSNLTSKLENWTDEQEVGPIFKELVSF